MTAATVPAVVVTYYPDAGLAARLAAIAREAAPVFVVDNTTAPAARAAVAATVAAAGAHWRPQPANLGLGAALNAAFAELAATGHAAAIAFDQDSEPAPGCATALAALHAAAPRCAAVGANWEDAGRPGCQSRHLCPHPFLPGFFARPAATRDLTDVLCVIASGTRFDLGIWRALGGFDAGLRLDLVDTDYCLRAQTAGYGIAVASGARLLHRRGAKRPVRRACRTWWPAFMPPARLRLLHHNRMRLLRRHGARFPAWTAFELVYAAKVAAEILLLEDNKAAKLGACLCGTWNGLLGRESPPLSP